MDSNRRTYIAIDCKSFYASVECLERGLDPMATNLVVADESRTDKTICLAVSPSLKAHGVPGRPRLFEVIRKIKDVNRERLRYAPNHKFTGKSCDAKELAASPELELDYIVAVPHMAHYIQCSTDIYQVYLKYVEEKDIHVYSIDEVFIDITEYMDFYKMSARELAGKIVRDVQKTTGIVTTVGIGTNLYLAKVAMDIVAKHTEPDENGTRIAELDEMSYRYQLWGHRPLTDFWRVGRGYAKKLEEHGLYTMGDIARCSLGKEGEFHSEKLLYKMFGVNAELLIDHAWGVEPCTMAAIHACKPRNNSISSGQVLQNPYDAEKARLIVKEMADMLSFDLLEKRLLTDQITLTIGFDRQNLENESIRRQYKGKIKTDFYGRSIPEHAHVTEHIGRYTSSAKLITDAATAIFDRTVDKNLLIRRITIEAAHVIGEKEAETRHSVQQLDLFTDWAEEQKRNTEEKEQLERERKAQLAMLSIRQKYGKNAALRASSLEEGATAKSRNNQIGGHRS